jgi:hypothetical protein
MDVEILPVFGLERERFSAHARRRLPRRGRRRKRSRSPGPSVGVADPPVPRNRSTDTEAATSTATGKPTYRANQVTITATGPNQSLRPADEVVAAWIQ